MIFKMIKKKWFYVILNYNMNVKARAVSFHGRALPWDSMSFLKCAF